MPSPIKHSSSPTKSKSSPIKTSTTALKSRTSTITLDNINDDVLQIMFRNLTIKQLLHIYKTNTAFSKKEVVIEMDVVDLSNLTIDMQIINFLDKVLDKSKIRKLILNNTNFAIKTPEQFSGNTKIFENVKELQIKNTAINVKANYFLKKYLNIEDIKSLKIRRLVLDNISFASDEDFEAFNYNIEYYQNLDELIINNFNSVEGRGYDADGINYFNELIEKIRVLGNLKRLRINHTDITAETDWDETLVFVDVFLETLGELVNLQYLKFYKNNVYKEQLDEIERGLSDRFTKHKKHKNVWIIRKDSV
jgi:hypothetical protein